MAPPIPEIRVPAGGVIPLELGDENEARTYVPALSVVRRFFVSRDSARPEGCRHGGGVVVGTARRNLAFAQREDHYPMVVIDPPGGLDAAAFVPEDHDTVPLGDEFLRLELLDLFHLIEHPKELPHLVGATA